MLLTMAALRGHDFDDFRVRLADLMPRPSWEDRDGFAEDLDFPDEDLDFPDQDT